MLDLASWSSCFTMMLDSIMVDDASSIMVELLWGLGFEV
jgi:hypothetical protein